MNKVININLAGRMIAIDESAYEPLRQYINWLRQYFGKEPDGPEIVQDMESRIAEIFESKLRKGSPCILPEDVQHMIGIMGSPEQLRSENGFKEDSSSQQSYNDAFAGKKRLYRNESRKTLGGVCAGIADYFNIDPIIVRLAFVFFTLTWGAGLLIYIILWIALPAAQPSISNVNKRLFRNTEKKVLGGVCSGLALYFRTDVVFIRLLFVAPLLLTIFLNIFDVFWGAERFLEGGIPTMLLLYLVLWVSIPSAKTLAEKLEMSGAKVDVQNISNAMRNEAPVPAQKSHSNVIGSVLKIFVFIILAMILMLIISLIIGIIGLVIGYGFSPMKNEFPFYDLIITNGDTELILWTSIVLILVAPLILILSLMKRILSGRSSNQSNYWYKILPVLFVLGIAGIIFSASDIAKNYYVDSTATEDLVRQKLVSDTLFIRGLPLASGTAATRASIKWEGYSFLVPMDNERFAFRNVDFDIMQSGSDSLVVTTTKSASGRDAETALKTTDSIVYNYGFNNNNLELATYTALDKSNPFRFQKVTVTIYIPANKAFKVDEALTQSRRSNFSFFDKRYDIRTGLNGNWKADTFYKFENGVIVPL